MQPANVRLIHDEERLADDGSLSPAESVAAVSKPGHAVQFYDNESFLSVAVANFIATGLTAGQSAVIIATPSHRKAFTLRLAARGLDVEYACRSGQLLFLDAADTLASVMDGRSPDAARFRSIIGGIMERAARGSHGAVVRAYGEMVDVLWKDGNAAAALSLEDMWNDLATTHTFTLLCSYAMGNFYKEAHGVAFQDICRRHSHVIPTENYTQADDEARLVQVSILQQRARALEAEIEHRRELEQRLRESLREGAELLEREQAARAEAENANRAKSMFLAMMSHELRTPLNAIAGYTDLIEIGVHGPVTEGQRGDLARIRHSQQHLLALINDLLNFAQLDAGELQFRTEVVGVPQTLARVEELTMQQFQAKDICCAFRSDPVSVSADPDRMCQILINLLSNAAKFTEPGGSVTVTAETDGNDAVCIRVRDTGPGIAPEDLAAIFDPFVQLGRSFNQPSNGVGLGLAISRDLARGMGGELSVASELGQGSTFTLTLPASRTGQ